MITRAFKYRLYPTKPQEKCLEETLETARRWYNLCLEERIRVYETEKRTVHLYEQTKKIKDYRKNNVYAGKIPFCILTIATRDVDKAYKAFFRRVKSGEKEKGFPKFKGRDHFDSFGLQVNLGYAVEGKRLRVNGIGRIRVRWHRELEGIQKQIRIKREANDWYVIFFCELCDPEPLPKTDNEIGIDVGIHHLLATSDYKIYENPRFYRNAEKKLRILERRKARRKKGGSNRKKTVLQIQKQHRLIANQRRDCIEKITHELIKNNDCIAIEDLQITNMVKNKHLSKSILDAGWGYFRQRLKDKAEEAGRIIYAVNPAYTSKTCHSCGSLLEDLTLSDRWITCECGASIDRDINAALNILERARRARWGESTTDGLGLPHEPQQHGNAP